MHKLNIVYYEGQANRDIRSRLARSRGEDPFRPYSIRSEATLPIVPRPGDHVYFPITEKESKFYSTEERDGTPHMSGVVQWVEMYNGCEDMYVIVTDEGHEGRGIYSGDLEEEIRDFLANT